MMMLVSTISYIDRNTLALLAPTILRETHLSNENYGYIISAFSIAYMLANPVWGRILDRIGVRRGMSAAVSLWSLASASHALAGGFWGFASTRTLLGFGEGATFPGGMRTAMETLDPSRRARGIAIAYSGGSLGAILTPIVITPVALLWGWRGAFWFTGLVGAAWLVAWLIVSRRTELRHAIAHPASLQDSPRWRDPRLWAFLTIYALGGFPIAFILYNSSLYLSSVLHKSLVEIGQVLWIPPLGWELGYFFWGWMVDRFNAGGNPRRSLGRMFFLLSIASLPLAATPHVLTYVTTLVLLFVSMFVVAGFIIGAMAYVTGVYSRKHSGLIAGLGAGAWSALVALLMPRVGRLLDLQRWDLAFLVAGVLPFIGWMVWRFLDREPS
jgi:ACS family hexuronate transporter-like MFS transporter